MPFRKKTHQFITNKYILAQVDIGGFNNIKMVFENYIVIAYLTNRILVLPPPKHFYLLENSDTYQITDFLKLDNIKNHIQIQYYYEYPINCKNNNEYQYFLENKCYRFDTNQGLILEEDLKKIANYQYITYNTNGPSLRLLDYWYCQVRCNNQNLKNLKHIMGEKIQFVDIITNTTNKLIKNSELKKGYNAIHIRKGDFQWKEINNLSIEDIYQQLKYILDPDTILYILTDQKDKSIFNLLYHKFKTVLFWDDIKHLYPDINQDYIPMIEMTIGKLANIFVGSRLSTFSGNIMIMRGFHKKHLNKIYKNKSHQKYSDLILYTNKPPYVDKTIPYPKYNNEMEIDVYQEQDRTFDNNVKICTWDNVYRYFWN